MQYSDRSANPTMNTSSAKVGALGYKPSKQPVSNAGKVDKEPSNANTVKSRDGMASWKQRQKGTPNRSYPVEVVNKARARMGGH